MPYQDLTDEEQTNINELLMQNDFQAAKTLYQQYHLMHNIES
tara:strand:+ start:1405 stop:1530 length:126 start_codon:yes stop_codon:yes gene_type:complete